MNIEALKDLGEEAVIRLIVEKGPSDLPAYVRKGIGDDAAVLETGGESVLLVTTDTLLEGTHFTSRTLPAEALGWKSLAVNMSDIVAMGGIPRTALLSVSMPANTAAAFLEAFLAGFKALADGANIALVGGDVVETMSSKVVTVTLLGDCLSEQVVYRSEAKIGDDIWVTGSLGNAAAGLFLLIDGQAPPRAGFESLILAHQKPTPRLNIGKALAETRLAHAMIDVSDGIAKDLGHICEESGVGALLKAGSVPLSDALIELATAAKKNPLDWALYGGEDYELLFTAAPSSEEPLVSLANKTLGKPPTKIGTIVEGKGISMETPQGQETLRAGGYAHFS